MNNFENFNSIIIDVLNELESATEKFPSWPTDPLHALGILGEEYGELNKAILQLLYEPHKTSSSDVRNEAIQTAAMVLRFLIGFDRYIYLKSPQRRQYPIHKIYLQAVK